MSLRIYERSTHSFGIGDGHNFRDVRSVVDPRQARAQLCGEHLNERGNEKHE